MTPLGGRRTRWLAIAEIAVVTGAVLTLIWVLQPLGSPRIDLTVRILIVGSMLVSNVLHRDSLRQLGIRVDNLGRAVRATLPSTAVAAGIVAAIGLMVSSPRLEVQRLLLNFLYYLVWGFAQQYALQGFVLRRLFDTGLTKRAPLAAAVLFALVHVPNPGLVAMTFAGGWMWCTVFRREPNLLTLAVSHACLAVIAESMLPETLTGGYRLGPRYLRWALRL